MSSIFLVLTSAFGLELFELTIKFSFSHQLSMTMAFRLWELLLIAMFGALTSKGTIEFPKENGGGSESEERARFVSILNRYQVGILIGESMIASLPPTPSEMCKSNQSQELQLRRDKYEDR